MADDGLSPAELELLLTETQPPAGPPRPSGPRQLDAPRATSTPVPKRVRCVGHEQLRELRTVHERFADRMRAALSQSLRLEVDAKLILLDQVSHGELVRGLDTPTCVGVLEARPLGGELGLDIHHTVLLAIIDRLLGGGREPGPPARGRLTIIEERLAARVARMLAEELRHAWHDVADLEFHLRRLEHDPHAARIAPPDEPVVRVRLELAVGAARGFVTICLPGGLLRSIDPQRLHRPTDSDRPCSVPSGEAASAAAELIAELARTRASRSDVESLQVGDVITTEQNVQIPLVVRVDGAPRFVGRAGVADGRKAVRIERSIAASPGDDPRPPSSP